MNRLLHLASCAFGRFACFHTQRITYHHFDRLDRSGGYVLACTHLSHLEPILVSIFSKRPITWMARIEFYRHRFLRLLLNLFDAFPVDRAGHCFTTIRTGIARAKAGGIVGIFPEGGVARGEFSVCRGGAIKRGACVIANRAGVPIVPVVVLGADQLNRPLPWIPWRRGALWFAVGEPVWMPTGRMSKAQRIEASERLRAEFRKTYDELCAMYGLSPSAMAGERSNDDTFAIPAKAGS